jgi:hypothetical protein
VLSKVIIVARAHEVHSPGLSLVRDRLGRDVPKWVLRAGVMDKTVWAEVACGRAPPVAHPGCAG